MLEEAYLHNDSLEFCDKKLSLHDCNIDQIAYENDGLKLYLSGGLWITPNHEANAYLCLCERMRRGLICESQI